MPLRSSSSGKENGKICKEIEGSSLNGTKIYLPNKNHESLMFMTTSNTRKIPPSSIIKILSENLWAPCPLKICYVEIQKLTKK